MLVGSLTCFLIESVNRIFIQLEQDIVNIQIAFTVGRTRTRDLFITNELLYQLSHFGNCFFCKRGVLF